jgi:hypothetical protein
MRLQTGHLGIRRFSIGAKPKLFQIFGARLFRASIAHFVHVPTLGT